MNEQERDRLCQQCMDVLGYLDHHEWITHRDAETMLGDFKVPLLAPGFRMVVFSVVIMVVVLFFRKGIMGTRELWDLGGRGKAKGGRSVK